MELMAMKQRDRKKIRVLLAQTRLDSHGVGLRYLSKALMDEGMEVIIVRYGVIEEVEKAALEENVDVVGLSYYFPGFEYEIPLLMGLLKKKGLDDLIIIVGGIIDDEEETKLLEWGVKGVFTPGRPVQDVIEHIISHVGIGS
jgi:methylmalonyl-CoA mutase, C-terminal domain